MTTPSLRDAIAERLFDVKSCFEQMSLEGEAPFQVNEPRGDVFFDVTIEGIRFQATAAEDPYVARKDNYQWCQLGVASIERERPIGGREAPGKWMVCKYSASEGRIDLNTLSDAGRRTFSICFGVPLHDASRASRTIPAMFVAHGVYAFYGSRAFDGLMAWAERHPRKFKAMPGAASYLGNWKSVVSSYLVERSHRAAANPQKH